MARAAAQTKIQHPESIATPSRDDFAAMLEQSFETQSPQEGAVIKGKIVAIENDFAMVDVGLKTEGRVPLKEFAMPGGDKKTIRERTLAEMIGTRARSRLHEMCRVVLMPKVEDYRVRRVR